MVSRKKEKIYCGDCNYLPSAVYTRFGTRRECLEVGIGVGRTMEFEHQQAKLKSRGIRIRKVKRKSCKPKSARRR